MKAVKRVSLIDRKSTENNLKQKKNEKHFFYELRKRKMSLDSLIK